MAAGVVLWIYIALRLGDLAVRGVIPSALDGSWQSVLFAAEILIGGILPAILLMIPHVRNSREGLITAGVLTAFGIINQRMALILFTMGKPDGASYIPTGLEVAIACGVPAAAFLIYIFFTENLVVSRQELSDQQPSPYTRPRFDQSTGLLMENKIGNSAVRRSGLAVLVIALMVAALPWGVRCQRSKSRLHHLTPPGAGR